jgi:TRAP-type C4-dicarboxylate transport system substrate-binding protein
VSAVAWSKLNADQQSIFREESAAAGDLMRKLIAEQEEDQVKRIEASGMQVTRPNIAPFRALMGPAYERISAYAGSDNVKKFQQMADQGRTG